jgi:hypothetical protein
MRHLILVSSALLAWGVAPPKPVEQMSFGELLNEGKEAINNITLIANMAHHPQVVRMQNVLNAFSKTLPLVTYDQSISPLERGADGLIHGVFHPIDTARNNLAGLSWDLQHITQEHSSFIILRGLVIFFCLYIIIGAFIMAKYYNADGVDRIPHLSFWMAYPGLVVDGIAFVSDRLGCDVSPSTYQRLSVAVASKNMGSRDTFSQFEPI